MEDAPMGEVPELMEAARCALPIIFTSGDLPEFPGLRGTCTALRSGNESVFVTAAHVVRGNDHRTVVEVGLGFRGPPLRSRVREMLKPRPAAEQFDAVCDFAVMVPTEPPAFVEGDSAAYDLARVALMRGVQPKSSFAVCGYPSSHADRNFIDYAERSVTIGLQIAIGTYEAPSPMNGHHILEVSTSGTGGPDGFSGGPVFRLLWDRAAGKWTPVLAGIVTMGGPERVHFIDISYVVTFLQREVFRTRR